MRPNEATLKLILDFEVIGGQVHYDRYLRFPTWPGGESGVTIGIGYDLGYHTPQAISSTWQPRIGGQKVARLLPCAEVKGVPANALIPDVRDVEVPWDVAWSVFQEVDVPEYWAKTCRAFPGVEDLDPNAQGALLSLVFNRGSSLSGPRRMEMAAIRDLVQNKDYAGIAAQIRAMKRLWVGTGIERGMTRRRNAEADLVASVLTDTPTTTALA